MRRSPALPVSAILAALTALALVGAALSLRPPALPAEADDPREAANREVALAFYDAINHAIAGGDLTAVARLVAPDLLAAGGPRGDGARGVSLGDRLTALHATDPGLRLRIEALAADGDVVIARVTTVGTPSREFLGLPLTEQADVWAPVDVLRVVDRRIVELGDATAQAGLLRPAIALPIDVPADRRRAVTVRRVTLAAGAAHLVEAVDGPRLLYVEAGTIAVEVVGATGKSEAAATLVAGEHLSHERGAAYAVRNAGPRSAALLDLTVARMASVMSPPLPAEPRPVAGVSALVIAHSQTTALPDGPLDLAIGRASLAPGARLAWAEAAGPVLLHVEAGAVRLDPRGGVAWGWDGTSRRSVTLGDEFLEAGIGALVAAGNAAELRAGPDASASVLIVTMLPAGDPIPSHARRLEGA